MRKTIERTITVTEVTSATVKVEKGLPVFETNTTDIFNGTLSDEKALKEVQKLHGATAVVIEKKEVNDRYEISVEDFMKYATKVV
jgi:hypothetical protein